MVIKKIKNQLRQYKTITEFARVFRLFIRFISIPFYLLVLRHFAIKHKINKDNYVLFFSGSTGDMFYMSRLLDAFAEKNGPTTAIAPIQYKEIFKLLSNNSLVKHIWLDTEQTEKMQKALMITRVYERKGIVPGNIIPTFLDFYHNLQSLIKVERLGPRDAFTWIMGLDKDTPYRYIAYSEAEKSAALAILSAAEKDVDKIALINPICYTHKSISVNSWKGIADALVGCGYKPVFNLKRNPNDLKRNGNPGDRNQYDAPEGFPTVEIPAYLVPVCADLVGMSCARHGGGFDLLYAFSDKNNISLLISVSPSVSLGPLQQPEPFYGTIASFYKAHSGTDLTHSIQLYSVNDEKEAYDKVINVLSLN